MKPRSAVFREAAKCVCDAHQFCCIALRFHSGISCAEPEIGFLTEYFDPGQTSWPSGGWWGTTHYNNRRDREARILALLLCAEMIDNPAKP